MGGPCWIVDAKTGRRAHAGRCTDNFAVQPFEYKGKTWQSCEQAFQAAKFNDEKVQERIRLIMKGPNEHDGQHGMKVFNEGRSHSHAYVGDAIWNPSKVDVMYDINKSRYLSNPENIKELFATTVSAEGVDFDIEGGSSTSWHHPQGQGSWTLWNGVIHARLREEFKAPEKQDPAKIKMFQEMFTKYREAYNNTTKKQ